MLDYKLITPHGFAAELVPRILREREEDLRNRFEHLALVNPDAISRIVVTELEHYDSRTGLGVTVRPDPLQRRLLVARLGEAACRGLFDLRGDAFRWVFVWNDGLCGFVDVAPRPEKMAALREQIRAMAAEGA